MVAVGAMVVVVWNDNATSTGWGDASDGKDDTPETIESVGWVIGVTRGYLHLCGDRNAVQSEDHSNNRRVKINRTTIEMISDARTGKALWKRRGRSRTAKS